MPSLCRVEIHYLCRSDGECSQAYGEGLLAELLNRHAPLCREGAQQIGEAVGNIKCHTHTGSLLYTAILATCLHDTTPPTLIETITAVAWPRTLHAELDAAILGCYGWDDLEPGHGFHPNEHGQTRYTVSYGARWEILARLLKLNLEVAARERGEFA